MQNKKKKRLNKFHMKKQGFFKKRGSLRLSVHKISNQTNLNQTK